MELEQAIRTRRTHKAYGPEAVPPSVLEQLFELARWAPNHHLTNPWRFRVLGARSREQLMELAEATQPGSAVKLRRAPTLIAVSALLAGEEAQDREDLLATAVAAYIVAAIRHATIANRKASCRPVLNGSEIAGIAISVIEASSVASSTPSVVFDRAIHL